ncbi:MAG: hypothetical protein Q9162_004814 [Coniocarpon cinnabarinum]
MNRELRILREVFPDLPNHLLHNLVTTFEPESRLFLITEALLSPPSRLGGAYLHTTFDIMPGDSVGSNVDAGAPRRGYEMIRSDQYKDAVRAAFKDEFSGIDRSLIERVLVENNWAYIPTRQQLLEEPRHRSGISSLLFWWRGRKPADLSPLIIWPSPTSPEALPSVKPGVPEVLADELQASIVNPLKQALVEKQFNDDRELAESLAETNAQEAESLYECRCCYVAVPFEMLVACSSGDHFICHRCLQHTVSEAVYGQGWDRSVDTERGTIKCFALVDVGDSCDAWITYDQVSIVLSKTKNDKELLARFHEELARLSLQVPSQGLLQCPACPYSEVATSPHDQRPPIVPMEPLRFWFIVNGVSGLVLFALGFRDIKHWRNIFLIIFGLLMSLWGFAFATIAHRRQRRGAALRSTLTPTKGQKRSHAMSTSTQGQKFICRSPTCSQISCLNCLAVWKDPHTCFATDSQSLRTYVEAAISAAIKRHVLYLQDGRHRDDV